MAEFGHHGTLPGTNDNLGADGMIGIGPFTPGACTVTDIFAARPHNAVEHFRLLIYADSSGSPGALVYTSPELSTLSGVGDEYDGVSSLSQALGSGAYWLFVWFAAAVSNYRYDAGANAAWRTFTYSSAGAAPNPFGSASTATGQNIDIYAVYTPGSTTNPKTLTASQAQAPSVPKVVSKTLVP